MENAGNKKRIVLIEDEQVLVNLLKKRLEEEGYEVQIALDGVSGLELIHTAKPDLVLLDMMLPRMSGFSILEQLNAEKIIPAMPLVIVSNSGQPIELDRALKLGVRDYLVKVNFDLNEVVTKVNLVFNSIRQEQDKGAPEVSSPDATVLLIEDEVFLLELLERKFAQENIKTMRAMDGETARSIMASDKDKIDAVLLDLILPGINGITLLKEFKADASTADIPVIIASNLGQREEIERGMEAGAIGYIIKSNSTPPDIVAKVKELIIKK